MELSARTGWRVYIDVNVCQHLVPDVDASQKALHVDKGRVVQIPADVFYTQEYPLGYRCALFALQLPSVSSFWMSSFAYQWTEQE